MTPKEALEVLVSNLDQRALRSLSSSDSYWTVFEEITEAIKTLEATCVVTQSNCGGTK